MTDLTDREILVIDDSPAVGIFLREFLLKLGFQKIHCCENGKIGLEAFNELVDSGKIPIVFLDYNMPDMNALSVLTQMLNVRPDVKVIIETARERSEESIKEVIAQGAYQYLSKPIRLENVKEIMKTLTTEENYQNISPDDDIIQRVEFLITTSTRTSLIRISQYMGKTIDEILPIIQKLEAEKKIIKLKNVKEIACPDCGLVKISQIFHCPSCKGSNFKQERLIEHYQCSNVSSANSYVDDICPKCRKKIRVLGSDYRVMNNYYVCNDCTEKFPELSTDFLCLRCNNRFEIEKAKWETSPAYGRFSN